MKLIIGLGNPGLKYQKTWHNLGFIAIDKLRVDLKLPEFKENKKLKAFTAEGQLENDKIILAKPETYMNESGRTAELIRNYYKMNLEDIIVIHDDVDLELGKIRIVKNSSAGGHNGIKSIIEYLNSQDFIRIKIGAKTSKLAKVETADYVLEKFHLIHGIKVKEATKLASQAVQTIATRSLSEAMNLYN
jgi:PTH1 family peptidyl-tRNA hydrolase